MDSLFDIICDLKLDEEDIIWRNRFLLVKLCARKDESAILYFLNAPLEVKRYLLILELLQNTYHHKDRLFNKNRTYKENKILNDIVNYWNNIILPSMNIVTVDLEDRGYSDIDIEVMKKYWNGEILNAEDEEKWRTYFE